MGRKINPAMKAHKEIFFLIAIFSFLRLWVASSFGLGVDEAHYLLYAIHLDLSYVDHPPLVGWIHAPFYYLFGTNEFFVRLPAILLSALTSFLAYRFTLGLSESKKIALIAVLGLNSSFMFNALSLMLLPDSILLVLIFLLIFVIQKIEERPEAKYFFLLGLLWGLAGLAKYTSVLLVPPFLIYLLIRKRYDLLFSKHMLTCAAVALLCITPVLYWNLQNDWVSFRYQGIHMFGSSSIKFKPFFLSLAAQMGSYSPFLFGIAFYGFFKSFRSSNERIRLSLLLGGILLLFFLYTSLYDVSLPHWSCHFYVLFIPIGIILLSKDAGKGKRVVRNFSIGISLIITLFLYVELAAKWFTFPHYQSPFRDIYGWSTIAKEADEILKENHSSKKALAVTEWTMGSRMIYYSLPYQREVFVIDQRRDQFDYWQKDSPLGYDLLFINSYFSKEDIGKSFHCGETKVAKKIDILLNRGKVESIEYVWCKDFRGVRNEKR
jgi:4-amino-4-deoxy-L-arabinose transferase-like glycosyltransferase